MESSPTTPIIRCKKRQKNDADFEATIVNLQMDVELSRELQRDETAQKRQILSPTENILASERNFNSNYKCVGTRTDTGAIRVNNALEYSNNISEISGYPTSVESQRRVRPLKSLRRCYSGIELGSSWPMVEVEQLASMLQKTVSIENLSMHSKENITRSLDPGFSDSGTHEMIYDSPSSSSNASMTDDERPDYPSTQPENLPTTKRPCSFEKRMPDVRHNWLAGHRLVIIDCRYPYEFQGGHIRGAINIAEWPLLKQFLFSSRGKFQHDNPSSFPSAHRRRSSKTTFILHCEFSSQRAPRLFNLLRNHDRLVNLSRYPELNYPFVYLLRGGYAAFYEQHPELCVPSGYLKMQSRPELSALWSKHCTITNQKPPGCSLVGFAGNAPEPECFRF